MLPKEERRAMLLRLYNDETPLIDHSQTRRNNLASDTPTNGGANVDGAEPETLVDENGGVQLNADVDEDIQDADATAPIGETGVEADSMMAEDRLRAEQQVVADEDAAVAAAPERKGESDEFNTTV